MNHNYTEEEKADVIERQKKAFIALEELQLGVSVQMVAQNVGNDVFGLKPIPYLADLKYSAVTPETAPETTVAPVAEETITSTNETNPEA